MQGFPRDIHRHHPICCRRFLVSVQVLEQTYWTKIWNIGQMLVRSFLSVRTLMDTSGEIWSEHEFNSAQHALKNRILEDSKQSK